MQQLKTLNIYLENVRNELVIKIDMIYTITFENATDGATSNSM